jgi:hypothetical protein
VDRRLQTDAVSVEDDARPLKSALDRCKRRSAWLGSLGFELTDCRDADFGFACQIVLSPVEKAARGAALKRLHARLIDRSA